MGIWVISLLANTNSAAKNIPVHNFGTQMYICLLYIGANWGIGRHIFQKALAGSVKMNHLVLGRCWKPQQV